MEEREWAERAAEIQAGREDSMLSILEQRGFVNQVVGGRDDLERLLNRKRVGIYIGVDPTAPSLHVGHLVPLMALYWMNSYGFHGSTVLGGSTAMVGDPSGRKTARVAQADTERISNTEKIHKHLKRIRLSVKKELDREGLRQRRRGKWELSNNSDWLHSAPMMEIMRLLLPGVRLGTMLGRDTVKTRMQRGTGMSIAEFLYPVIQAWDWWHLYSTRNVQIQIGGSDQFGNILAGMDAINFIRKTHYDSILRLDEEDLSEEEVLLQKPMGFTTPLLTAASGEKFGKSSGNAIWLDQTMTSPFDLYQFFLGTADADVYRYLKLFSFESMQHLDELMKAHDKDRSRRLAQHALALTVLRIVHGKAVAEKARDDHTSLFKSRSGGITLESIRGIDGVKVGEQSRKGGVKRSQNDGDPLDPKPSSTKIALPRALVNDQPIARVLWSAGLVGSISEGRQLCTAGGAYVGTKARKDASASLTEEENLTFTPVDDLTARDASQHILDGDIILLRAGKRKVRVIHIVSNEEFLTRALTAPGWQECRQARG